MFTNTSNYLPPLVSLISLWTAAGVLLHDVQLDAAAVTALSPVSENREGQNSVVRPSPHTHPEHNQMQRVGKQTQPRVQPKRNDYRMNTSSRKLPKDNYSIKPPKAALNAV